MNIILENRSIGGFKGEQVFITGLNRFQLVLRILCLTLGKRLYINVFELLHFWYVAKMVTIQAHVPVNKKES